MTRQPIKELFDNDTETPEYDEVLVFDQIIRETDGEKVKPSFQPDGWDNVRHIVGNIYVAWDSDVTDDGAIYLGHFEKVKP